MTPTSDRSARRSGPAFPGTGIPSLVLVFVLLCLLTFAVLSLLSARADLHLSEKSAARTTAWYEAENAANDVLAGLNGICAANAGAADAAAFCRAVQAQALAELDVTAPAPDRLVWEVPCAEQQVLHAEVVLRWPAGPDGLYYTVEAWQAQNTYAWNGEQPLELMQPGAMPDM